VSIQIPGGKEKIRFLSVCLFAVLNSGNDHKEVVVVNFVKDSVGTLANAIATAMKLLDS